MSPAAPRPTPESQLGLERRLRNLELTVVRRLDGLLQSQYRGTNLGPGTEPGEGRPYRIGDDIRRMDWKLTARTGAPHVRDAIADRELELWFVLDRSRSLDFGTARYLKREVALGAVAALGSLAVRAGSRVGAVHFGDGPVRAFPARPGHDAVRRVLRAAVAPVDVTARETGMGDALRRVQRLARRRGVVVLVSDFLIDDDWEVPLRGLRAGHDLIAVEVVDPRELELPPVGALTVTDPESGAQVEVRTTPALRARYAEVARIHREGISAALRGVAADHVVLSTGTDWLKDIARFLRRRRLTAWLTAGAARSMAR